MKKTIRTISCSQSGSSGMNRRTFLKTLGGTTAGVVVAGCRTAEITPESPSIYTVRCTRHPPKFKGQWLGATWQKAKTVDVASFRPEGSTHRPQTQVKLLYDKNALYGIFRVRDKYVRSVHTKFQDPTYKDSCIEFFIQPKPDHGYFNFEFNAGGTLACSYISEKFGSKSDVPISAEEGKSVRTYHSLPDVVDPEIQDDIIWCVEFAIPFSILEHYVGKIGDIAGQSWRGNFYKCADETSHPHWASWQPVDQLNFHLPRCFGTIVFES